MDPAVSFQNNQTVSRCNIRQLYKELSYWTLFNAIKACLYIWETADDKTWRMTYILNTLCAADVH